METSAALGAACAPRSRWSWRGATARLLGAGSGGLQVRGGNVAVTFETPYRSSELLDSAADGRVGRSGAPKKWIAILSASIERVAKWARAYASMPGRRGCASAGYGLSSTRIGRRARMASHN